MSRFGEPDSFSNRNNSSNNSVEDLINQQRLQGSRSNSQSRKNLNDLNRENRREAESPYKQFTNPSESSPKKYISEAFVQPNTNINQSFNNTVPIKIHHISTSPQRQDFLRKYFKMII